MKEAKTKTAPRPRRGRPRSEHARQEILEAAYKPLRDNGFNAVGSHEIAQAAGVSTPRQSPDPREKSLANPLRGASLDVTLAYLKGQDAESEEAQEHANRSGLARQRINPKASSRQISG